MSLKTRSLNGSSHRYTELLELVAKGLTGLAPRRLGELFDFELVVQNRREVNARGVS